MAAPKIKLYQLPPGFTQESDGDVQYRELDELLPIIERSQLLADAVPLSPITPHFDEALQPIDIAFGRTSAVLAPTDKDRVLRPADGMGSVVVATGTYGVIVKFGSEIVPEKNYTIRADGVAFADGVVIPASPTIEFYRKATLPATTWALGHHQLYDGTNASFNKLLVRVGTSAPADMTATGSGGYVTVPAATVVKATYATWATRSKNFCGDHDNWMNDHLRLRPDVFVGKFDYPGDDVGELAQGLVPKFRDPTSYAISPRMGLVTFSEWIDPDDFTADEKATVGGRVTVVRALYSYFAGLKNVTGQRLQPVAGSTGRVFKAATDAFVGSVDKRWVRQNTITMPLNIRVDGVAVPKITSVAPYEELTVKMGPTG